MSRIACLNVPRWTDHHRVRLCDVTAFMFDKMRHLVIGACQYREVDEQLPHQTWQRDDLLRLSSVAYYYVCFHALRWTDNKLAQSLTRDGLLF